MLLCPVRFVGVTQRPRRLRQPLAPTDVSASFVGNLTFCIGTSCFRLPQRATLAILCSLQLVFHVFVIPLFLTPPLRTPPLPPGPFHMRSRCHPGDDQNHESTDCRAVIEEVCRKGHVSKRQCTKDPAGLPCRPCEREAAAIAREVARLAESKHRREQEREAACARLAEARRTAVSERERLAHEMDLLRMERETQREELDAERTRYSQQNARAKLDQNRAAASKSSAKGSSGGGGGNALLGVTDGSRSAASSSLGNQHNQSTQQPTSIVKGKDKKGGRVRDGDGVKTTPEGENDINVPSTKGGGNQLKKKGGTMGMMGSSTLLLVATAAATGNAGGIVDALHAIPPAEREKTSHELAAALGDAAYEWFPPSSGGEPIFSPPPGARTTQALGLMGKGEWVKARVTLAAALKDDAGGSSKEPSKRDPSAVYALALCDHHLGGGTEAARQLSELATVDQGFWSGPPDGHLPPDARAFPLRALVRAHLEASAPPTVPSGARTGDEVGARDRPGGGVGDGAGEGVGAGEDVTVGDSSDGAEAGAGGGADRHTFYDDDDDPKLRACLLAVSFLRAPAHNLKAGKVDSPGWKEAAEAVVRSTGAALSRALWGPDAAGSKNDDCEGGGDGGGKRAGDKVRQQWRGLRSKWGVSSEAMDDLLKMSGLDSIKADFLSVAKLAVIDRERGFDLSARSFNVRLEGNPGTGKLR